MCKGAEEKTHVAGFCKSFTTQEEANNDSSYGGAVITRGSSSTWCELCGLKASLYCQADDAYLCGKCDKWVHRANFLALRHIRCFLCNTCQNLTRRYLIGASMEVILPDTIENLSNNRDCSEPHDDTPFKFL